MLKALIEIVTEYSVNRIRAARLARKIPSEDKLKELVGIIVEMRNRGCGYKERMACLRSKGLPEEIAEKIIIYIEENEP